MKKITLAVSCACATFLVACGSGGSSGGGGSNTNPPSSDTYSNAMTVNTSSVGQIQSIGTSGSTSGAYLSTSNGLYSVSPNTQSQSISLNAVVEYAILTPVVGSPTNVIQISGSNGQVYYATPQQIYSYINNVQAPVLPITNGNLSALSQASSNGTLYYGTSTGFVGALNNPAGKEISQITGSGGVLAIGCIANGSCNSGKQGIMALTVNTQGESLPYFESTTASSWSFPTSFWYYNLGTWIQPNYKYTLNSDVIESYYTSSNNPGIQGNNATVAGQVTVNEYITAVTFNGGNIYVGTNLFNIYVATNYACNNGQAKNGGCPITFTGPINQVPLGWLQTSVSGNSSDGSVGISYIAVQSSGQLLAIAQESSTYAIGYVSKATTY